MVKSPSAQRSPPQLRMVIKRCRRHPRHHLSRTASATIPRLQSTGSTRNNHQVHHDQCRPLTAPCRFTLFHLSPTRKPTGAVPHTQALLALTLGSTATARLLVGNQNNHPPVLGHPPFLPFSPPSRPTRIHSIAYPPWVSPCRALSAGVRTGSLGGLDRGRDLLSLLRVGRRPIRPLCLVRSRGRRRSRGAGRRRVRRRARRSRMLILPWVGEDG